jgi:hypothetical protein
MLWDLWDPQHGNISRIPKHHDFRETTLLPQNISKIQKFIAFIVAYPKKQKSILVNNVC